MLQYNFIFNFVLDSTNTLIYILGHYQFIYHMCACYSQYSYHGTHVEVKKELVRVSSLYTCMFWESYMTRHRFLPCQQPFTHYPISLALIFFPCSFYQKKRRFLVLSCYESFPIGIFILLLQTGSQHAMICLTNSHSNIQHMAV